MYGSFLLYRRRRGRRRRAVNAIAKRIGPGA
ncbi:hypothetical protein Ae706Ps2_0391 [Pseudonocardia sp. Ae706_Ps2]|nr:hypothetical protein Ae706Ps2_0391 [Pseudonocardia sp. Ae706_Ps2]